MAKYNFQAGFAGVDYGLIVTLWDIPLEKVTLDHDGVKFLADYDTTLAELKGRVEKQPAYEGIGKNGYS